MTKLSVNVNKLATLRNSRGKNNPDVLKWASRIESYGAHGITVHPRPDGRHIRFDDVRRLKPLVRGEFNIEGYPDDEWLKLVLEVRPTQATLVPDPPEALTSNAGFDVSRSQEFLARVVQKLASIRVSVFIDPLQFTSSDAENLKKMGVARIELYTERFAEAWDGNAPQKTKVLEGYRQAAEIAQNAGLGVNAGHDLNLMNLGPFVKGVGNVQEVSIGHALICDALEFGMEPTVKRYINTLSVG